MNPNYKGSTGHPMYSRWKSMFDRCYNENCKSYHRYGGRGISISEEWQSDFFRYAEEIGPPPGDDYDNYQVDRIDNNGHYEDGNCQWVTNEENSQNRRSSCKWVVNGKQYDSARLAWEDIGVSEGKLYSMVEIGDCEKIEFNESSQAQRIPLLCREKFKEGPYIWHINGDQYSTMKEAAEANGVAERTVRCWVWGQVVKGFLLSEPRWDTCWLEGRTENARAFIEEKKSKLRSLPRHPRKGMRGNKEGRRNKVKVWHIKGEVFDYAGDAAEHFGVGVSTVRRWVHGRNDRKEKVDPRQDCWVTDV